MFKRLLKNINLGFYNKFNKSNNKIYSYINRNKLEDYIVIESGCEFDSKIVSIGRGTYINKNTMILNCSTIGRFCSISHNVKIGVGSHPINWISTSPLFYSKSRRLVDKTVYNNFIEDKNIIIKNDVWIGCNVIIMPGVTVGNGSIIASGSIVTQSVPDYSIVMGVPAKIKKYRFNETTIKELLKSKWWDKEICILKDKACYIDDPLKFIENLMLK